MNGNRIKGFVAWSKVKKGKRIYMVMVDDIKNPLLSGRRLDVYSVQKGVELIRGRKVSFFLSKLAEGGKEGFWACDVKLEDEARESKKAESPPESSSRIARATGIAVIKGPGGCSVWLSREGREETKKFHEKESGGSEKLVGFISLGELAESEKDCDIRHGLMAIDVLARLPGAREAFEKILNAVYNLSRE